MTRWAILTGEYPPHPGGVSDYTRLTARGLAAAGDAVTVYAPPAPETHAMPADTGVVVNRLPGRFGPGSLASLESSLRSAPRPDRILVQYVPHAFGWKAMNLPFALLLARRFRRIAPVWVVFHEVAFPLSWWPPQHTLIGGLTRVMARLIAGTADRVFVSIPTWGTILKRLCPRVRTPEWLPVPCTLEGAPDPADVTRLRARFLPTGGRLVGHFGTYGPLITDILAPTLTHLLRSAPHAAVLLVGRGSDAFRARYSAEVPGFVGRVISTGELPAADVSAHLRACDLVLQPFSDGVSSRRTSVMAAMANRVPVATNLGFLSEPVWAGKVATVPAPDPSALAGLTARLLSDDAERLAFRDRGNALYRELFSTEHTIAKLRGGA